MKQEEKDLLIKDLCGRLPYGVKCMEKIPHTDFADKNHWTIDRIKPDIAEVAVSNCHMCWGHYTDVSNIKPFLFPMSSMTEDIEDEIYKETGLYDIMENDMVHIEVGVNFLDVCKVFSILNKHHLDYNNLIPTGLAEDATGLNVY